MPITLLDSIQDGQKVLLMHRFKLIILVSLLFPVLAYSAIYKWTDSEGNIHYSEKAPKGSDTKELNIQAGPSEKEVSEAKERMQRTNEQLKSYKQERVQKESAAKNEKIDAECAALQSHITKLQSSGPYELQLDDNRKIVAVGEESKAQLADGYRERMRKLGCK